MLYGKVMLTKLAIINKDLKQFVLLARKYYFVLSVINSKVIMFLQKSKNSVIAEMNTICDNVKLVAMNKVKNLDVVGDG